MSFRLVLALIVMSVSPAFAHPGPPSHIHSLADGIFHPLTGADHVLVMASVGLWGAMVGGRAIWAWPASFVAVMLAGFAAARLGWQISFAESAISASIVVLGLLAVLRVRAPVALGAVIVGLFAFFHGHVHGTETTGGSVISYAIGFALSTAVLHGAGIVLGLCLRHLGERTALSPLGRMPCVAGCDGELP
jgi:urease accessory protein